MSQIRKKSIISTIWIFFGFVVGGVNTYLYTHTDWFTPAQYGLTSTLIQVGSLFFAFANMGTLSFINKFFPYYEDNLEDSKNDLLGLAVCVALAGFVFSALVGFFVQPLILQKFNENARMLVDYYFWVFPIAFFMLLFQILESYSYGYHKGVLSNILRETVIRLFTLVLILLKIAGLISFNQFIILFSFQYAVVLSVLVYILVREKKFHFHITISRVTKKFRKKIVAIMALTYLVIIVAMVRQSIDNLVLASKISLAKAGIFTFATYLSTLLLAPNRSLISVTIPLLSRAWKDKNLAEIHRIYKRSSINLLLFALFAFCCIMLNYEHAVVYFRLNPEYLEGAWVFALLGIQAVIELGTGINAQIIGTSTYWRFELLTGLLLAALIIPLSYILTTRYGLIGPAIANLVSLTIYNAVRFGFLWKKFNMQPFTIKTLEVIIIAVVCYTGCYLLLDAVGGLSGLVGRTVLFSACFIALVLYRNISPDVMPVVKNIIKRLGIKTGQ
jgi:O-antigen/teichoic acid export membrane protein